MHTSQDSVKSEIQDSDKTFSAYSKDIIARLLNSGYDPNAKLHSSASIKFYANELQANEWVMNTLRFGHSPEWRFNLPPPSMRFDNNKSAASKMDIVREQVLTWESKGVCSRVSEIPFICNPLTLSEKIDAATGSVKYRVCLDLSRSVNLYVTERSCSLDDMSMVLPR